MKTTFWVLFTLFFIVYSAEPNIKFKPFSITFESPYMPFALLFLMLSFSFFSIHYTIKGHKEGIKDTINEINKQLKEKELDFKIIEEDE